MAKIHVSEVVPAAVDDVWEYIRDFNGLPKWFPGVTDSYIEAGVPANQPGCIRNFGLEVGARMRERLVTLSDKEHSCHYKAVECPLPITGYQASVQLSKSDAGKTLVEITSQFDVSDTQEKEMVGLLTGTYTGAFALLKKHFGKG